MGEVKELRSKAVRVDVLEVQLQAEGRKGEDEQAGPVKGSAAWAALPHGSRRKGEGVIARTGSRGRT